MNHIKRLTAERDHAQKVIRTARAELTDLECYLTSAKFAAPESDYVHVRTDILPKLSAIRFALCGE